MLNKRRERKKNQNWKTNLFSDHSFNISRISLDFFSSRFRHINQNITFFAFKSFNNTIAVILIPDSQANYNKSPRKCENTQFYACCECKRSVHFDWALYPATIASNDPSRFSVKCYRTMSNVEISGKIDEFHQTLTQCVRTQWATMRIINWCCSGVRPFPFFFFVIYVLDLRHIN